MWKTWINAGFKVLSDITSTNNIDSFNILKEHFKLQDSEKFKYMQLKSWIKGNCDIENDVPDKLKSLLEHRKKKNKFVSSVYTLLITANNNCNLLDKIYDSWNKDLDNLDSKIKWKECLKLTYIATTNENLRMIQYKLMTRMYYSRDRIHKFDPSSSPLCLKCCKSDSLIHAFWYCDNVLKTWLDIEKWLSSVCKQRFTFTPEACIFQKVDKIKYPRGWQIIFSSLIYKKLLLQNWKNKNVPGIDKWKSLMKYYLNIEKTISADNNKQKQFDDVWTQIFEAL